MSLQEPGMNTSLSLLGTPLAELRCPPALLVGSLKARERRAVLDGLADQGKTIIRVSSFITHYQNAVCCAEITPGPGQ